MNKFEIRSQKSVSHINKTKTSKKGNKLTLEQLRTTVRAFKSSEKQAKFIECGSCAKAEAVSGVSFMVISRNAKQRKQIWRKYERRFYRFGEIDHSSKDENSPGREVACYKWHRNDHFANCCKTKPKHLNLKKRPKKWFSGLWWLWWWRQRIYSKCREWSMLWR